jgi:putative SOS response-associated peptidase YedK
MCGGFVSGNQAAIEREFSVVKPLWTFAPSYNVAPTDAVPVVRIQDGERIGLTLRWGLIPFLSEGPP